MDKKTVNVYTFNELSKEAQQKALEDHRNINVEYWEWYHSVQDQMNELFDEYGFEDVEMIFNGFYSQGDGASFTAKRIDIDKFLTKTNAKDKYPYPENALPYFLVKRIDTMYYHENTCRVDWDWDNARDEELSEEEREQIEKLASFMEEVRYDLSKKLYKDLQEEYEYLTGDDAVSDVLVTNEYEFLSNGERFDMPQE